MQELALVERAGIFAFTALARQPNIEGEDAKRMRCFMEAR
jgi:hypothetical protein